MFKEILIKFYALDEAVVTNSSCNRYNFNPVSLVCHLKIVGDEGVILISNSNELAVWTHFEAERTSIVVWCLERKWQTHLLQIEEPDVIIVASSYQEQN